MLLIAVLGACVPLRHSIEPFETDAAAARELERHAIDICGGARGVDDLPPYPFTTDGCSLWFDDGWQLCCIEHDIDYWCGGSAVDRCAADRRLRRCVMASGHPFHSSTMYGGVRIGGAPWMPFPWRWGYGWDWPYAYDDPTGRPPLRKNDEGCSAADENNDLSR